jgi:hypothetical protein
MERNFFFTLAFVIVYSDHQFGCNNSPKKGPLIRLNDIRSGLMRCTDEVTECKDSLSNLNNLSQHRKSPFNIRLRGGKASPRDGNKKRQRKALDAEEVRDLTVDNTKSILYQAGGVGFGKVEVVPNSQDNLIPEMEDIPEGGTPMFEVNLTEMRGSENHDESGSDSTAKEYSHPAEW